MRSKRAPIVLASSAILIVALLMAGTPAAAQTETVLYSFDASSGDAKEPMAGLISDASGNLYGTTYSGGEFGYGAVFELVHKAGGGWTEKLLHSFPNTGDGAFPLASLVFDGSGNLYGTTQAGGVHFGGTVFELKPKAGGVWREAVVHSFNQALGYGPWNLIFDASGNLYSTTPSGGVHNLGTAFELSPRAGGGWTEKVLHSFYITDGTSPYAGLVFDAAGNLYGTTFTGGNATSCFLGCGAVFQLTPRAGGGWTETVLHNFDFNGTDGILPTAGLTIDAAGNLYGTTQDGGAYSEGIVFELTPTAGGSWTETVLHDFNNNGTDGWFPEASLILDASGRLYGTTGYGGTYNYGTVFKLTPATGGNWAETVLHSFNNNGMDGFIPRAGLIMDSAGNLYGTTANGGPYNGGTVFEITP
jgi:uncharacterized repeat protein (TIGR03803 family)